MVRTLRHSKRALQHQYLVGVKVAKVAVLAAVMAAVLASLAFRQHLVWAKETALAIVSGDVEG